MPFWNTKIPKALPVVGPYLFCCWSEAEEGDEEKQRDVDYKER